MTQWTITRDHISSPGERSAVGTVGPRGATLTAHQISMHPDRKAFRMYDDDGELYYSGFLVGPDEFAPLDDYGTPNAGATEIRIRDEHGRYNTL